MFYTYNQNNSGGLFDYDEKRGIGQYVIVEADTPEEADSRAEEIGLYFDGSGDCECCGPRWSPVANYWNSDEGTEEPMIWDSVVVVEDGSGRGSECAAYVHYADSTILKAYTS